MKFFVHTLFHHAVACIVLYSYPNRKCEPIREVLAYTVSDLRLAARGKYLVAMYTGCGLHLVVSYCRHPLVCMSSVLQIG